MTILLQILDRLIDAIIGGCVGSTIVFWASAKYYTYENARLEREIRKQIADIEAELKSRGES